MAGRRKSYGNVKCKRIYPTLNSAKQISELKTIAVQLTQDQAIDLAKKLLAATQQSKLIDVTGFRLKNLISVTSPPTAGTSIVEVKSR